MEYLFGVVLGTLELFRVILGFVGVLFGYLFGVVWGSFGYLFRIIWGTFVFFGVLWGTLFFGGTCLCFFGVPLGSFELFWILYGCFGYRFDVLFFVLVCLGLLVGPSLATIRPHRFLHIIIAAYSLQTLENVSTGIIGRNSQ